MASVTLPKVLQLDAAGNPQKWIEYEQYAYQYAKDNVLWEAGEATFDMRGGTNAATGVQSILTINTIIALKGTPTDRQVRHFNRVPLTNKALFRRDQHVCAYCGNEFSKHELTRDHVIPSSKGGKNSWTNVVSACKRCNKRKDDNLLDDINMELLYVPYKPNRYEWLILHNRKILADQMDYLLRGVTEDSRLKQ